MSNFEQFLVLVVVTVPLVAFFIWREKRQHTKTGKKKTTETKATRQIMPEDLRDTVVYGFADIIEKDAPTFMEVRDVSELPWPKETIFEAYVTSIALEKNTVKKDLMKACLLNLAQYQKDVGSQRIRGSISMTPLPEELTLENTEKYKDIIMKDAARFLEQKKACSPFVDTIEKEQQYYVALCSRF